MVHFVLAVMLLGGAQLQVDWSELAVHFYGPVDMVSDTTYRNQLKTSMDSLLNTIPLTSERSLGEAVARSRDAQDYFRTSLDFPQVVSTRYSTTGDVQNEYVISFLGPYIEELIPTSSGSDIISDQPDSILTDDAREPSSIPSTGFVIDARGTGFRPGIFPRIIDPQGRVVMEPATMESRAIMEGGYINFAYTPRQALENRELGLNPLRIVAQRAAGSNRCDLVVSAADLQRITSSPLNMRLLAEGKVTIIIDHN